MMTETNGKLQTKKVKRNPSVEENVSPAKRSGIRTLIDYKIQNHFVTYRSTLGLTDTFRNFSVKLRENSAQRKMFSLDKNIVAKTGKTEYNEYNEEFMNSLE